VNTFLDQPRLFQPSSHIFQSRLETDEILLQVEIFPIVNHSVGEYLLSPLTKISLQIWLVGSVVTDGIITVSMLYLVSLRHLSHAREPLAEHALSPTPSAKERAQ
jgi:hypothetical protein